MRYFVAVLFLGLWVYSSYAQGLNVSPGGGYIQGGGGYIQGGGSGYIQGDDNRYTQGGGSGNTQGLDMSPGGLANQTAATISCVGSPLFVFALITIPVVFVIYYFASYLNIEKRARAEGKGSFFSDELLALILSSLIVASFLYLIYQFWNYWGIPVKGLFEKMYLCGGEENCPLILPVEDVLPETCKQVHIAQQPGFKTAFFFLLSLGSTFYKTLLVLLPIFSVTAISIKNVIGAVRDVREKRYSYQIASLIVFVDGIVIMLTLLIFTNLIYKIILSGISYQDIASWWFKNVVDDMLKTLR